MESSEIKIREAVKEDLPAMVPLWKEMMDFHFERDDYYAMRDDADESWLKFAAGHIENKDSLLIVAERDGEIVGYCLSSVMKRPPVFEIQEDGGIMGMVVTERFRRTGIGERFVGEAKKYFAGRGLKSIVVSVAVRNEVSVAFWEKMGFRTQLESRRLEI